MVPRTIVRQLSRLQRRERWLQLTWLAARWLPVLAAALVVACLIDWFIDRRRDTPHELRVGLLAGQAVLWSVALIVLVWVGCRRRSPAQLALWVEDRVPQFGHRLISAVQLNQPGAAVQGMSPELIAAVTRQAEEETAKMDFARLTDTRRLRWSAGLIAPVLLGAALLLVFWPETVHALLARQFLAERPIPRSVEVVRAAPEVVWPSGEEVRVRFRVRGDVREDARGEIRVDPDNGQPSEQYELLFESKDAAGEATFVARVPPATIDFGCLAWVQDGRAREPARVHYEPRPVVQKQEAWVQLPATVGLRADSQPFEEPQKGGDIVRRLPGSSARLAVEVQKPIVQASVEILGLPHPFAGKTDGRSESVRRSVDLTVYPNGAHAQGTFPLTAPLRPEFLATLGSAPGVNGAAGIPWAALVLSVERDHLPPATAYRIVVRDRYGFDNLDRPRRSIRTAAVDPPEVALLPEYFAKKGDSGSPEEREVEGIPVLLGGRFRLDYKCAAEYGLSHAQLRYRVIKKRIGSEDESEPAREQDFLPLPLGAPRGATQNVSETARQEFFTLPSADPNRLSGREGGGRYDFDSMGIPDGKGGLLQLQAGDRIQFFVEVFGRADPDGVPGRSAMREKEVVGLQEFLAWLEKKDDQKERIRQLEERQRGTIGRFAPGK